MTSVNKTNLITTLPKPLRYAAKFIRHQEQASGLSTSRFIQDVSTCLIPKAVFSRSTADLTENVFQEMSEETLIYFAPAFIGQKIAGKIFSKGLDGNLKNEAAKTGIELVEKGCKADNKKILPVKAAIALTAMIIPLAEFSLSYIKNLMTLRLFKKSDFRNIAALDNYDEDTVQQSRVRQSAKNHIKLACGLYTGCLGLAALLAAKGKSSKQLQGVSEFIVAPGNKLFKNSPKIKDFVNKYFCIDFNSQNGKLCLSKGQLTTCVLTGGFGYFGASADRGKENLKETAARFPLVAFYVITGSELVEKGFKHLLHKFGKCKELLGNDLNVPKFDELKSLAEKLSEKKGTEVNKEYKSLVKQKVLISGLPYIFSIGIMGFFVAGMTVHFTKKRYENAQKREKLKQ